MTDERKLEEVSSKLQKLVLLLEKGVFDEGKLMNYIKYLSECHNILMERVYGNNKKEVDHIPLIMVNN